MKSKKINKLFIAFIVLNFLIICALLYFLSPVGNKGKDVDFIIEEGSSISEIAKNLEKAHLIKSDKFFIIYVTLHNNRKINAAKYVLNDNMKLSKIVDTLKDGGVNPNEITITFKEGLNMRQIARVIAKNTNNSVNDVYSLCSNKTYLRGLIKKYWFINRDIANSRIYYSLEGYLYPDSYNFESKDVTVQEIFDDMLENTNKKLEKYKKSFEKSKYTPHQIFTLASLIELEVAGNTSRKDVSGVFYNRLKTNMPLGSDASSYYGVKKSMTSEISSYELDTINDYNTRVSQMAGKLPVGPICNPSISSISAALNPSSHEYYYFVTDRNGKLYLTKDFAAHNKIISELKAEGLWLEW